MTTPKVTISEDGYTVYVEPYTFANQEEALQKSLEIAQTVEILLQNTVPSTLAPVIQEEN